MKNKFLLLAGFFALLLSGCATTGGSSTETSSSTSESSSSSSSSSNPVIYTVTWQNYNSEQLAVSEVEEGATAVYPNENPTRPEDASYTYAFSGWDKVLTNVRSSFTTKATYTETRKLINFTGVTFASTTIPYDGNPHTLTVSGAPSVAQIVYKDNGPFTDVGVYPIQAKLTAEGYNPLTLNATLTIEAIAFGDVNFENETYEYDGRSHSVSVSGNLPLGSNVVYSSTDTPNRDNFATDVGTYTVTARITNPNFITKQLTAVLKITASDSERQMIVNGDKLYFQNAIDSDKLYAADLSSSTISKINNDIASDMLLNETGIMYVSKSFASSIKTAKPNLDTYAQEVIQSKNALEIQKGSGSVVYYIVNGLTQSSSGIFKFNYTDSNNPVETRLSVGKAKHLTLVGSVLYFADGNNGYKLSKISTSSVDQTRTLVLDEKINNLIHENGILYFTVNNLLGDYIARYNIDSKKVTKLTIDAGASLTIVGNYLYYVNVDLFTTAFIGKGIYRVAKSPLADSNSPGEQIISAGEEGVSSLCSDGTNLFYYDINGYKLMKYNINSGNSINLLEGFVKPADPSPFSSDEGMKIASYENAIYYLDLYDGRNLHRYDTISKNNIKITSNKVADFSIIGDYLYFNSVSFFVNNDIYRMNLKLGDDPILISKNSGFDFVEIGNYIYYARDNQTGFATAINRINKLTLEDELIYEKGVSNLRVANGKLLFIDGYQIYSLNPDTKVLTEIQAEGKSIHTTVFDTDGTNIYYRDMYSVLWLNKQLSKITISGQNKVVMVSAATDPTSISVVGNNVFYYSDTTNAKVNGLYKIDKNVTATTSGASILLTNETYYSETFYVYKTDVYFINKRLDGMYGDSFFYKVSISGGTPVKIS